MPRRPRVTPEGPGGESESTGAPPQTRAERRAWLSQLKEDAVRQLLPTASPAVRGRLRLDVQHALRHHGPDDPALEVEDIVVTLVAEACRQLDEAERHARRAERRPELMIFARWTLAAVLSECPTFLVGAPGSGKRTQTTWAVWADLRLILEKTLSGAESEQDVRQRIEEYVAQWQREHDHWWHPRLPSAVQVVKAIHTAKKIRETVNNTPELRQLADTIAQAARILWRERRQRKGPPTAP